MRPRKLLGLFVHRQEKETNETAAKLSISPALPCYRKKLERLSEKRSPFEKWGSRLAAPTLLLLSKVPQETGYAPSCMQEVTKWAQKWTRSEVARQRKIEKKPLFLFPSFSPFFPPRCNNYPDFSRSAGGPFFAKERPKSGHFCPSFRSDRKSRNLQVRAFAAVAISPNLSEVGRGGEGGGATISHFP